MGDTNINEHLVNAKDVGEKAKASAPRARKVPRRKRKIYGLTTAQAKKIQAEKGLNEIPTVFG